MRSLNNFLLLLSSAGMLFLSACEEPTLQQVFQESYGNKCFISIQVQRANAYLNWKSPASVMSTLALSAGDSMLNDFKHVFGHATLVYGRNGVIRGFGETGDHQGDDINLLLNGFGFTSFTDFVFTDGHLETDGEVNDNNIDAYLERTGKFAWLTFLVDEDAIDRIEAYVEEFRAQRAYSNYAFTANARSFQGAVCTTFVNAALDAAGISFPAIDRWVRRITAPARLMGFNSAYLAKLKAARYTGPARPERKVSILSILATFKWAAPGTGETFSLYDPELMFNACAVMENLYRADHRLRNARAISDAESSEALELEAVLADYYHRNRSKCALGSLYATPGIVIDLRD